MAMTDTSSKRRKLPGIGTLVVLVVLLLLVTVVVKYIWPIYRERTAIAAIAANGNEVFTEPYGPDWLREECGLNFETTNIVVLKQSKFSNELLNHLAHLPNLQGIAYFEPHMANFNVKRLERRLPNCTLIPVKDAKVSWPYIAYSKQERQFFEFHGRVYGGHRVQSVEERDE